MSAPGRDTDRDLVFDGGRYAVVDLLGRGGFGTVYKAYDRNFDLHVALKVIQTDGLEHTQLSRFKQLFDMEAKIARRLEHPGIVRVHDYDPNAEPPYVVMSLAEGGSLQERLAKRRMPWKDAAVLGVQIADALHYAHGSGVHAHRDVKPGNIFCARDGRFQLGDFGVARVDSQARTAFFHGGTASYMAPEQIADPRSVDARSDLFSLGVVLYQAMTGRPPYRGVTLDFDPDQNPARAAEVVASAFTRPPSIARRTGVPRSVESIVMQALATNPAERFADCAAFANALRDALAAPPTRPWLSRLLFG